MNQNLEGNIDAVEIWFLRRNMRILWADKKMNSDKLLLKTIGQRQLFVWEHMEITDKMEGEDRGKFQFLA